MDTEEKQVYTTHNTYLAAYLAIHGLELLETRVDDVKGKKTIVFVFLDLSQKAKNLEIQYINSNEKKYKDTLFLFKKRVFDSLKGDK